MDDVESVTHIEPEPVLRRPHAMAKTINRGENRTPNGDINKQQKSRYPAADRPHDARNNNQRTTNNQDNRYRQNQNGRGNNQDGNGYNKNGNGYNQDGKGYNQDGKGYNQDRKGYNQNQRRPQRQETDEEVKEDNNQKNTSPYPTEETVKTAAGYPKPKVEGIKTADPSPVVKDEVTPKPEEVKATKPAVPITQPAKPVPKGPVLSSLATTPVPRAKPAKLEEPLVPEKCVVDLSEVGATLMVSIESEDEENPGSFICLTLHNDFQDDYLKICNAYSCDDNDHKEFCGRVGTTISFRPATESAWYRARVLSPAAVALLDAGRVAVTQGGEQRALVPGFVQPEFAAALTVGNLVRSVQVGEQLKCVIESKTMSGVCKVSLANMETDELIGQGELRRWLPKVDYPAPAPLKTADAAAASAGPAPPAQIPAVPRPQLRNSSAMELVHYERDGQALLRDCDVTSRRDFDMIEQDVAVYGLTAAPLKTPPTMGDTLIAQFTDGNYYRVLCKRTNVSKNKYLLEYIEYGNTEVSCLEKLRACPPQFSLQNRPPLTSRVQLQGVKELSDAAADYLNMIRDESSPLVVTLPNGADQAPSGAEVILTLSKNKENINSKVIEMSKPEWKKVEEKGGDMFDMTPVMLSDIEYLPLPLGASKLKIIDCSMVEGGSLSVCAVEHIPALQNALGPLTEKMEEYCNSKLGSEPYLPRYEEVCIAKCPPYAQWFRSVFCEHIGGPGGASASLLYLDYGNLETVAVDCMRRCPTEFAAVPVAVCNVDIYDFPEKPTAAQLAKAREYLKIDSETGGEVTTTKCEYVSPGLYTIHVPGLIAAMNTV